MPVRVGEILGGRYRVQSLLARGGMADVWVASSDGASEVAVKTMRSEAEGDASLVDRFEREGAIARLVKSPHVCALLDEGKAPDGTRYLVLERLRGESLQGKLKREKSLSLATLEPIVRDVLVGLGAAHRVGVIHRDLKPGNVFLLDGGAGAKLLDFGVAKVVGSDPGEPALTGTDATVGSLAYMAPEQVEGARDVDARTDLYAVGVTVFRALTGRLPVASSRPPALVTLKLERDALTLGEATRAPWPASLESFFRRVLARAPSARPESAATMLAEWVAAVRLVPKTGPSMAPAGREEPASELDETMALPASGRRSRGGRSWR